MWVLFKWKTWPANRQYIRKYQKKRKWCSKMKKALVVADIYNIPLLSGDSVKVHITVIQQPVSQWDKITLWWGQMVKYTFCQSPAVGLTIDYDVGKCWWWWKMVLCCYCLSGLMSCRQKRNDVKAILSVKFSHIILPYVCRLFWKVVVRLTAEWQVQVFGPKHSTNMHGW